MPERHAAAEDATPPAAPAAPFVEPPTRLQRAGAEVRAAEPVGADSSMELVGLRLEHFELLDKIGAGGMGRVYRARDTRLDRIVAVKALVAERLHDPELARRFEQEAKSASRLDSPHFARVHHFGEDRGVRFIAMEFVAGANLRDRIAAAGPLTPEAAVNLLLQMALGLAHAAARGVVHRDIKPSNIIVQDTGHAKLVDLGLAREVAPAATEITQTHVTMGTLDYISPEQAADPRRVDVRSDLYSLGCTLFHALTGQPPYPQGTGFQKLLQHQQEPPPDARAASPAVPEAFAKLLQRMMAKAPDDRPQTAEEVVRDAAAIAAGLDVALPFALPALPPPIATPWWHRNLPWLAAAGALAAGFIGYAALAPAPETAAAWPLRPLPPLPPPTEPDAPPTTIVVGEAEDLAKALAAAPPGARLLLEGAAYVLAAERLDGNAAAGLTCVKPVRLEPLDATRRTVLRLAPNAEAGAAVVRAAKVRVALRRLTLVAPPGGNAIAADQGAIALEDCLLDGEARSAALAAIAGGELDALDCRFLGGEHALRTSGRGTRAALFNCAALRSAQAFRFDGAGVRAALRQCVVVAEQAPPVLVADPAGARLEIAGTVFAAARGDQTALPVCETGAPAGPLGNWWHGDGNRYGHGVEHAVRIGSGAGARTLRDAAGFAGHGIVERAPRQHQEWPFENAVAALAAPASTVADAWPESFALHAMFAEPAGAGVLTRRAPVAEDEPGHRMRVDPAAAPGARGLARTLADACERAPADAPMALDLPAERSTEGPVRVVRSLSLRPLTPGRAWRVQLAAEGPCLFDVLPGAELRIEDAELDFGCDGRAALFRCAPGGTVRLVRCTARCNAGAAANPAPMFRAAAAAGGALPARFESVDCELRGAGPLVDAAAPWSWTLSGCRVGAAEAAVRAKALEGSAPGTVSAERCTFLTGGGFLKLEAADPALGAVTLGFDDCAVLNAGAAAAPWLEAVAAPPVREGGGWDAALPFAGQGNAFVGFATLARLPEERPAAGMPADAQRTLNAAAWAKAQRLPEDANLFLPERLPIPNAWAPIPRAAELAAQLPALAVRFPARPPGAP